MAASILWSIFTSTSFLTLLLLIALAAISYHYVVKVGENHVIPDDRGVELYQQEIRRRQTSNLTIRYSLV